MTCYRKGGPCGPYEGMSCPDCPYGKPQSAPEVRAQMDELETYRAIGPVEEFRVLKSEQKELAQAHRYRIITALCEKASEIDFTNIDDVLRVILAVE